MDSERTYASNIVVKPLGCAIYGIEAVDEFKKHVMRLVQSHGLSFGYPNNPNQRIDDVDDLSFPLHLMVKGDGLRSAVAGDLGLFDYEVLDKGHCAYKKTITDESTGSKFTLPIEFWDESELGGLTQQ